MSLAIWDHTVLPSTRHKWAHPAFTPASQAGTRFTYPGGMEGWVDLGDLLHTEIVYPSLVALTSKLPFIYRASGSWSKTLMFAKVFSKITDLFRLFFHHLQSIQCFRSRLLVALVEWWPDDIPVPPAECQSTEFRCADDSCIDVSLLCNGVYDCTDGSDELDCGKGLLLYC